LSDKITLTHFHASLQKHLKEYGDYRVISMGCNSDNTFGLLLKNGNREKEIKIPMHEQK
jgi:hypothetical protein